jgi:hypothetical protein
MNLIQRIAAWAGLLLLALALQLDRLMDAIKARLGMQPTHGVLRITELKLDFGGAIPRRTKWAIGALAVLAIACGIAGHGWISLGLIGAAGTFANTAAFDTAPPQYTFRGVYTGGSSDTSPTDIPFPTAFASLAAALATAWTRTTVPICDVFTINAQGNVTAIQPSVSNANYILTYTTSGSGLSGFIATIGATIPNTVTQK